MGSIDNKGYRGLPLQEVRFDSGEADNGDGEFTSISCLLI